MPRRSTQFYGGPIRGYPYDTVVKVHPKDGRYRWFVQSTVGEVLASGWAGTKSEGMAAANSWIDEENRVGYQRKNPSGWKRPAKARTGATILVKWFRGSNSSGGIKGRILESYPGRWIWDLLKVPKGDGKIQLFAHGKAVDESEAKSSVEDAYRRDFRRKNSRGIPRVREWIITIGNGQKFRVLAPTKQLAILNLREKYSTWGFPIKSVGVARKEVGQREMVVEETKMRKNPKSKRSMYRIEWYKGGRWTTSGLADVQGLTYDEAKDAIENLRYNLDVPSSQKFRVVNQANEKVVYRTNSRTRKVRPADRKNIKKGKGKMRKNPTKKLLSGWTYDESVRSWIKDSREYVAGSGGRKVETEARVTPHNYGDGPGANWKVMQAWYKGDRHGPLQTLERGSASTVAQAKKEAAKALARHRVRFKDYERPAYKRKNARKSVHTSIKKITVKGKPAYGVFRGSRRVGYAFTKSTANKIARKKSK